MKEVYLGCYVCEFFEILYSKFKINGYEIKVESLRNKICEFVCWYVV